MHSPFLVQKETRKEDATQSVASTKMTLRLTWSTRPRAFTVNGIQFRVGELKCSSFHLEQECPFKTFYNLYNILKVTKTSTHQVKTSTHQVFEFSFGTGVSV